MTAIGWGLMALPGLVFLVRAVVSRDEACPVHGYYAGIGLF